MDVEDVDVKTASKIYRATTYTSLPETTSYQSIGKGSSLQGSGCYRVKAYITTQDTGGSMFNMQRMYKQYWELGGETTSLEQRGVLAGLIAGETVRDPQGSVALNGKETRD